MSIEQWVVLNLPHLLITVISEDLWHSYLLPMLAEELSPVLNKRFRSVLTWFELDLQHAKHTLYHETTAAVFFIMSRINMISYIQKTNWFNIALMPFKNISLIQGRHHYRCIPLLQPLNREGSWSCHTYYYTVYRFIRVYLKDSSI